MNLPMLDSSLVSDETIAVDGLLFDFDGTLMNTIRLIVESFQATYEALNLKVPDEAEIVAGIGLPLEVVFQEAYPNRVDELLETYQIFNHRWLESRVAIYLGIVPMLQALKAKGIPLALVTAKRLSGLEPTLRQFEMEDLFDAVVTKFDTKRHKPYPDPLLLGLSRLGLEDPSHCPYVGDAIFDLMAAQAAGMPAFVVGWSETPIDRLREIRYDLRIEKAKELPRIVYNRRAF